MYEELIKQLRVFCKGCKLWDGCKCCLKDECSQQKSLQAADAIEELQKQRDEWESHTTLAESFTQGWIPVTERLPEEDGKYLTVYTLNSIPPKPWIEVCWFAKNLKKVDKYDFPKKKSGFFQSDSEYGFYEVSGITHWMPLPEPPKDGE